MAKGIRQKRDKADEKQAPVIKTVPTKNAADPVNKTQPQNQAIVKPKKPIDNFIVNLEKYEKQILPDLLQAHGIGTSQFKQIVISEIKKSSKLLEAFIANPSSMFASILAGAEIGLIPSELLGEFFLIPRNLKQDDGRYKLTVCPLIGYKGMMNILLRSGDVTRVHTEVVYEGEKFIPIMGLEPDIIHEPDYKISRKAKDITFVYAVAKMKNGEYQYAVMTREQIMAVKEMSKYDNDLYFNDKDSPNRWMERKTVLLQLAKMLPKDYYGKKAAELDGKLSSGATLSLEGESEVKIIEGSVIRPKRFRDIYSQLGQEIPSEEIKEDDHE